MTDPNEYEWLIPLWVKHEHMEDVLQAVNAARAEANRRPWTPSTLSSVANRLRKLGVALPKRPFREKLTDRTPGVARLNRLIDRLTAGETVPTAELPQGAPRPAPPVDPREAVRKILDEMKRERDASGGHPPVADPPPLPGQ